MKDRKLLMVPRPIEFASEVMPAEGMRAYIQRDRKQRRRIT